jgi:hypothetical protein
MEGRLDPLPPPSPTFPRRLSLVGGGTKQAWWQLVKVSTWSPGFLDELILLYYFIQFVGHVIFDFRQKIP